MKKVALVLLSCLLCCAILASCGSGNNDSGNNGGGYGAEDVRYVSEAGKVLATVSGRQYVKMESGTVAVGLVHVNGHTGPILVGRTAVSVAYQYNYGGVHNCTEYGTVEVNGDVYYYSQNEGFMSGNYLDFTNSKLDIYCCTATTMEEAAKELIPLLNPELFSTKLVTTVEELKALANSGESYTLGADIDLSGETSWTPIEGFKGALMGGGFKISNLTINDTNTESIGLFGTLTGVVQGLTLENVSITSRGNAGRAGAVAGTNKGGKIIGCVVSGTVNPTYYNNVGGICGYNDEGTIKNCKNQADVTGADYVGGLCGYVVVSDIEHLRGNLNEGIIIGQNGVGGVAGMVTAPVSNATYTVTENENKNSVTGDGDNVGGVFGEVLGFYKSQNWNSYDNYFELSVLTNSGEVEGGGDNVGGLVGKCTRVLKLMVGDNKADVTGSNCVGGFVGYAPGTHILATGSTNGSTITGKGKVGGFAGHAGVIENANNSGTIVSTAVLVEDGVSRAYVGGIAGYCEGLVSCKNNVDITVTTAGSYVGGLAGYVCVSASDKVNKNENSGVVTGADCVGGIAGYVTATVSNATYQIAENQNKAEVKGTDRVGGIFGHLRGFYKSVNWNDHNCYFELSVLTNTGEVTGDGDKVGGLIGEGEHVSKITICENKADVTGDNYVGGFVGYSPDTNIQATGVINNNTITGKGYVGGFAGYAGLIENATNNGEIVSLGIVVENGNGRAYVGGIAGYCTGIVSCTNNSDLAVEHAGSYVGGIAGYMKIDKNGVFDKNVNNGKIKGTEHVGGITGYLTCPRGDTTYTVHKNENKNTVTGTTNVGGIVGYVYGFYERYNWNDYNSYFQLTYCVNEAQITGDSAFGGLVGGYNHLVTDANILDTNTTLYGEKLGQ